LEEWTDKYATGDVITIDGHATHYIHKGAGAPVILLHGFFYDSYMWARNIDALAHRFKVYILDLWGFGYSTRAPLDYGYPLYADQLLKFMDALNIPKASLIGQSMGGGTSVFFAVRHRERIHKMILVDSTGMPNPLPLMGRIANLPRVGEFMYGLNSNFFRRLALNTNWIHHRQHITESYFEHVTRFHKVAGSTEVMLTILRKQFFDTLEDDIHRLGEMDVPVLIVWGRYDKTIPLERGHAMHHILSGSHLEIFEQAGHCPHDEQAAKFNQLAVDFLG
jgi:pimeloyl-ACP methyl ester carboxylesterase